MANLGHTDTMLQYFYPVAMPVNIWQILPYRYSLFTVSTDIPMICNLLLFLVITQNSLKKCFTHYSIQSSFIAYSFS